MQHRLPLLKQKNLPMIIHMIFYGFLLLFVVIDTVKEEENRALTSFLDVIVSFNFMYSLIIGFILVYCIIANMKSVQNLGQSQYLAGMLWVGVYVLYSIIISAILLNHTYNKQIMMIATTFLVLFAFIGSPYNNVYCIKFHPLRRKQSNVVASQDTSMKIQTSFA